MIPLCLCAIELEARQADPGNSSFENSEIILVKACQANSLTLPVVKNANVRNVMLLTMSERAWKKDKNFLTSNQIDLA